MTVDRAELERTLTMKSGALASDNARLTQELAEAQKAREEKVREVSSTYEQLVATISADARLTDRPRGTSDQTGHALNPAQIEHEVGE